jgi:hypothetical protein
MPFLTNQSTTFTAPGPLTSSPPEKAIYTSCSGAKPEPMSELAAKRMPLKVTLVSSVPRPHITPSSMTAPKGGFCQFSSSTGTTS